MTGARVVLASESPRRSELLARIIPEFETLPPRIDEAAFSGSPRSLTKRLSAAKAHAIAEKTGGDFCVIGADTIVYSGGLFGRFGTALGKPESEEDAARMLRLLSGRAHTVYTGVSVIISRNNALYITSFVEKTRVTFARLSEGEIRRYIQSGEYSGKAGAYAAQGISAAFIKKVSGDFNTVVGLPLARLYAALKEKGVIAM